MNLFLGFSALLLGFVLRFTHKVIFSLLNQDDGEMYDEFGTLKKKFRTKAKLGSALSFAVSATGVGKADLDDNIVGVDGYSREKSKDPSAYSLSSNPHENDKRCGHMDMKNSQLGRREHRHKGRGSKRTRGDF